MLTGIEETLILLNLLSPESAQIFGKFRQLGRIIIILLASMSDDVSQDLETLIIAPPVMFGGHQCRDTRIIQANDRICIKKLSNQASQTKNSKKPEGYALTKTMLIGTYLARSRQSKNHFLVLVINFRSNNKTKFKKQKSDQEVGNKQMCRE